MSVQERPKLTKDYIKALLDIRDFKVLRQNFREQEIADLAEIFSELEVIDCIVLFRLVPRDRRSVLFSYLPFDRQEELIDELPDVVVTALLNNMEPDDRTRFLEELSFELRSKILLKLDPEERQVAWKLLSYPEDSVGRLMTPDFLSLRADMQVSEALAYIRWSSMLPPEYLHHLFVADMKGRLIGEVSLAELVVCDPPTEKVETVMSKSIVYLRPDQEDQEAVEIFRKYDRTYIPVVDNNKAIIGIVTADDLFDVAEEDATEDIQQFGGQGALEDSYFLTPILTMLRKRAGWLSFLFFGMLFTASALRHYELVLDQMEFLAIFLPLVISSGGNSGTQAASLIIRGMALNEFKLRDWFKILRREIVMGISLGSILATLGYLRAVAWGYEPYVGVILALTLLGVVTFGAVAGSMLPFVFKAMRMDPAVVSSPFITTIVDLSGIIIFINIAIMVLAYFKPS